MYGNDNIILTEPWWPPIFITFVTYVYMHIFRFAKCQENVNPRYKMVHLSSIHQISIKIEYYNTTRFLRYRIQD